MVRKLLLLFALILFSCNENETNKISLFNNIYFKLDEGEKSAVISTDVKRNYDSCFNNKSETQIPLFKYIKNQNYLVFIGIPFNTNVIAIRNRKFNGDSIFDESNNNKNEYFKAFRKKNLFLAEYAISNQNSLIYISVITPHKYILDSLFTQKKLSSRLIIN